MIDEIIISRKGEADYDTLVSFQIKSSDEIVFESSLPNGDIEITLTTRLHTIEVVCDMPFILFKQKGGFIVSLSRKQTYLESLD